MDNLELSDIITFYLKTLGIENVDPVNYGITDINGQISLRGWNVPGVAKPTINAIRTQLADKVADIKELNRKRRIKQVVKQSFTLPVIVNFTDVENPVVGMMVLKDDNLCVYTSAGWVSYS